LLHLYELLLFVTGGGLLLMACDRNRQELRQRITRAAVGTAFVVYGLYLMLFFQGGMVFFSTLVFVIPVVLGIQFFRDRSEDKLRQEMEAMTRQYAPGAADQQEQ
jgi:ABC-type bacteriocin/lantibiotic exporter with double-glycine peptidase domain